MIIKYWGLSFWLSFMGLGPVFAATSPENISDFMLENGMQVVVIEDHRAPVVVHMVWYKAGSADETPGVSGVAHFLEHLLFKKTKTLKSGEFSRIVEENGGSDNAFTSYDYTAYFQRIAADRLPMLMEMEADRMINLDLRPEDILTERDVIIEERNQRVENSAGALFREQRSAAMYLNHPYGTPIIGWKHEMEALDLDDALDYYKRFYAPNNAILVVAGDVEPELVLAKAEATYGKLKANPNLSKRVRPSEPKHLSPRWLTFRDERVAQPYVIRTYLAPERNAGNQREAAALTLLAEVLGGGQTSVFSKKLQFESQQAVYTSAFYSGTSFDATEFGMVIVPSQGISLEDAEAALDQTILDFIEQGVDEAQLERIKMQFRASEIYNRDNTQGMANAYGRALTSGLRLEDIYAWPDIVQSVTSDDIIAAAKSVFKKENSVTGWLMQPEEEME